MDPRTPVVVGVGQTAQRVEPGAARAPIDLFADAARLADADAGAAHSLLERVDVVAVVEIVSWKYPDAGSILARRLGISPRRTCTSGTGGNSPQLLCNELGASIARGDCDVVLLGGAESMYTRWRARREPKYHLEWEYGDDSPCKWVIGDARRPSTDDEMAHSALAPTQVYPLFETALRAAAGHGVDEHQRVVSELWAGFSEVAAHNPNAWSPFTCTPEEIRTVGPDNRMVCFPYPKRMCSNIDVDQGAALLLCSYEAARAAGVPADRMVFLHAGADAHDHWFVSERWALAEAPAIGIAVHDALRAAGVAIDDVAHLDLYSCFPSAVQMALDAIGLTGPAGGDRRPLTVTGGLGFAGGPVNNYVTHSIARMVEVLRADPGAYGLTTALGWYATKHSAGVWSSAPPRDRFVRVDPTTTQQQVDALPRRTPAGLVDERVALESTAVVTDREGTPALAIATGLTPAGERAFANSRDTDVMRSMMQEPWEGRTVRLVAGDSTNALTP